MISKLLFSAIVLVAPFSEIFRLEVFQNVYIRAIDIVVFLFLLYSIFKTKALFKSRTIFIFIFFLIFSNLINFNLVNNLGIIYLLRAVMYFLLLDFILKNSSVPFPEKLIYTSLLLLLFTGFLQYFLYPDLRNLLYLGFDPHSYRLFGLFLDPNLIGIVFVWCFFWLANKLKNKNIKYCLLLLLTLFIAILLTYSRTSYLALATGSIYWFAANYKNKYFFIAIILLLFVLIPFLPKHFGEGTNLLRINSLQGKKQSWNSGLKLFIKKPVFGYGFNNIPKLKAKNQQSEFKDNSAYGLDNSVLTLLVTTGIVGLVSYFGIFFILFKQGQILQQIIVITYFIHTLFVNSLFTPGVFIFFILIYSSTQQKLKYKTSR
jgi:O-antigen ligase